ncbi:hypothetical protein V1515DRAFT_603384 [Lipomyces mesembrius]
MTLRSVSSLVNSQAIITNYLSIRSSALRFLLLSLVEWNCVCTPFWWQYTNHLLLLKHSEVSRMRSISLIMVTAAFSVIVGANMIIESTYKTNASSKMTCVDPNVSDGSQMCVSWAYYSPHGIYSEELLNVTQYATVCQSQGLETELRINLISGLAKIICV